MSTILTLVAFVVLVGSILGVIKAKSGLARLVFAIPLTLIVLWYFWVAMKLAMTKGSSTATYRTGFTQN